MEMAWVGRFWPCSGERKEKTRCERRRRVGGIKKRGIFGGGQGNL